MCYLFSQQKSIFIRLTTDKNADIFFKVFFDRIRDAQAEIRNTVSVNTSETEHRPHREEEKKKKGETLIQTWRKRETQKQRGKEKQGRKRKFVCERDTLR